MKEKNKIEGYLTDLIYRYPVLNCIKSSINESFLTLVKAFESDGKLLIAGNGGSAADAEHISGELLKSFCLPRKIDREFVSQLKQISPDKGEGIANTLEKALPVIPLVSFNSLSTAFSNDVSAKEIYAQLIFALGKLNDVFLGISTSGNSENIINAAIVAKAIGMKVIALTGKDGGQLNKHADISIIVPQNETFRIQELHLPIYHTLCLMLEEYFFGDKK